MNVHPTTTATATAGRLTLASSTLAHQPTSFSFSFYFPIRAAAIFCLGFIFAIIIDHLQTQHHVTEYPYEPVYKPRAGSTSWIPVTCGASAVLVGTMFPLLDYWWVGKPHRLQSDWSTVLRCVGGFIGIAYAATKLPWTSNIQVSCTLALISVGLWFLFDRTGHGFMLSVSCAVAGTLAVHLIVWNGVYSFTKADFFGVRSWIPCVLYSSCICFGSIGRQLEVIPEDWYQHELKSGSDNTSTKRFHSI